MWLYHDVGDMSLSLTAFKQRVQNMQPHYCISNKQYRQYKQYIKLVTTGGVSPGLYWRLYWSCIYIYIYIYIYIVEEGLDGHGLLLLRVSRVMRSSDNCFTNSCLMIA